MNQISQTDSIDVEKYAEKAIEELGIEDEVTVDEVSRSVPQRG